MTFPCPTCGKFTQILSTRVREGGSDPYVTRRRECSEGHRTTTREIPVQTLKSFTFLKKLVRNSL